jgi:hypothetical protein
MTAAASPRNTQDGELAAWTHMWMASAALTLELLQSSWNDEEPASSIGRRDALSIVVIDAVRNAYRGAMAVLPNDAAAVTAFETSQPQLVRIRDFFEHFDEYVKGRGKVQKKAQTPCDSVIGMGWKRSASSGEGDHTMVFAVREGTTHAEYEVDAAAAVRAVQPLVRAVMQEAGLLDARHLAACPYCR